MWYDLQTWTSKLDMTLVDQVLFIFLPATIFLLRLAHHRLVSSHITQKYLTITFWGSSLNSPPNCALSQWYTMGSPPSAQESSHRATTSAPRTLQVLGFLPKDKARGRKQMWDVWLQGQSACGLFTWMKILASTGYLACRQKEVEVAWFLAFMH